jgi:amino-acid N-acetyltransferase
MSDTARIHIRPATGADLAAVLSLLDDCQLPIDDLTAASLADFHVAECTPGAPGALVAVAGLEKSGSRGLLRSLAVRPERRGRGLGEALVSQSELAALIAGVREIYLLTPAAAGFFRRLGYQELSRTVVPAAIAAHPQFMGRCPASATCLGKRL